MEMTANKKTAIEGLAYKPGDRFCQLVFGDEKKCDRKCKTTPELRYVAIEPTNHCNLQCTMCYSDPSPRSKGFMSMDLFKSLVDQISEIPTIKQVNLFYGGEPLMHPRYMDMLEYVTRVPRRFRAVISTNGCLWNHEYSELVCDRELPWVHFSLDGVGAKHEEIRVGSNYDAVKKNIEDLLETRGDRKLPVITTNLVFCDHTRKDVEDFVREWQGKRMTVVIDTLMTPDFKYSKLKEMETALGLELKDQADYNEICSSMNTYMGVLWDGRTVSCCNYFEGQIEMGDANKTPLQKIFYEERYSNLRKMEETKNYPEGHPCKNCDAGHWSFNIVSE